MSKTYTDQIAKARMLVTGLSNNRQKANSFGISDADIENLGRQSEELDEMNTELEKLRADVSEKAHLANAKLVALRELTGTVKNKVKKNTDPLKWHTFGIPDKR